MCSCRRRFVMKRYLLSAGSIATPVPPSPVRFRLPQVVHSQRLPRPEHAQRAAEIPGALRTAPSPAETSRTGRHRPTYERVFAWVSGSPPEGRFGDGPLPSGRTRGRRHVIVPAAAQC